MSSYRGNRPANTQTNPQTEPITIHCITASAQCNHSKLLADRILDNHAQQQTVQSSSVQDTLLYNNT